MDTRRKRNAPARVVKCFYLQDKHVKGFEKLVFEQKDKKGKTAPELMEEAIEKLLKRYKLEF